MSAWQAFRKEVADDWVGIMSGIASVIFAALGAITQYSLSPWVFWPMGYLCLLWTCYRLWTRQYLKVLELEGRLKTPPTFQEKLRAAIGELLAEGRSLLGVCEVESVAAPTVEF
jgi:hypothetical protein